MLKVGFVRCDITPPLGVSVEGYFEPRRAKGVLDPLMATAVAFDDGGKRAVIISVDVIGMNKTFMAILRSEVAKATNTDFDGVFVCCTHTHLAPGIAPKGTTEENFPNREYSKWMTQRIADAACLAFSDIAPAKFLYTRGEAKYISYVRRCRMKDGSVRTNPGIMNPDIAHPLGTPDVETQLLIIKREGKKEIGIVNFQMHADTIGGELISADYPKFVRDIYEKNIPDSLCMYINGPEGNIGGTNFHVPLEEYVFGYTKTKYIGKKIAMSVLSNYELAREIKADGIRFAKKIITVRHNKGKPEEVPEAIALVKKYRELGTEGALPNVKGMLRTEMIAKACRIERMEKLPDTYDLPITALAVGDVVFAGFPGEPFVEVGKEVKAKSPFELTIPVCCANGYEGYYPVKSAYDEGGYEVLTAQYVAGTAEALIDTSLEIINLMK